MSNHKAWNIYPSQMALKTFNPIRALVDGMKLQPHPDKSMISLSIGDPTVFGNLPIPPEAIKAIEEAVNSGKRNGYSPSHGYEDVREAIARYISKDGAETLKDDIFLASGCSGALEIALSALLNPGDNVLIPRPGFSLYKTLCIAQEIEVRSYILLPEKSWEADLSHMKSLIDKNTKAIVVLNPSNPCGSSFSKKHVGEILAVAEQFKLPIISDEIYGNMTFSYSSFVSCASQTTTVPILTCGGIGKRFLLPGWRLGWIAMHDRNGIFGEKMRKGLTSLTQRVLGPCTLVQAAVPSILENVSDEFHAHTIRIVERNAEIAYDSFSHIQGLRPVKPQAAFYMMIGISMENFPEFKDDVEFTERMVSEQSVFCLPAQCFEYPCFFRIVLTVPEDKMKEACDRIAEFCKQYYRTT